MYKNLKTITLYSFIGFGIVTCQKYLGICAAHVLGCYVLCKICGPFGNPVQRNDNFTEDVNKVLSFFNRFTTLDSSVSPADSTVIAAANIQTPDLV
jgi:hypothetical protein